MTDQPTRGGSGAVWLEPGPARTGELRDRIKAGEFASPAVRGWRDQLTRIKDDLTDILASRSVIAKLQDVIARNPQLQSWNFFLERIFRWYATSTLVLVHRELHRRQGVVSLYRLLDDVRRHPGELTRVTYRRLHSGRTDVPAQSADHNLTSEWFEMDMLEKAYDRLSGGGDRLDVSIIAAEIAELVRAADEVEQLRHTVYAHRAAGGPALNSISLGTIHALVDVEENLVKKYLNVLFSTSYSGLTPVDLTDWQEILTFPWIMPPDRDPSI